MATWSRVPYENEISPIDVIEADGDLIVGTAAGAVFDPATPRARGEPGVASAASDATGADG